MNDSKRLNLYRFKQLIYSIKYVLRIAWEVNPRLLIAVLGINVLWGLSSVPMFYLEKYIIDTLIENVGSDDLRSVLVRVGFIVFIYLMLQFLRNLISSLNGFLQNLASRSLDMELITRIGEKHVELDLATVDDPEFRDKFDKIEKEVSRRTWGLMISLSNIPNYAAGFISALIVLTGIHPVVGVLVVIFSLPKFATNSRYIKEEYDLNLAIAPKRREWSWLDGYLTRNRNYMEMKVLELRTYLVSKMRKLTTDIVDSHARVRKKRLYIDSISDLPLLVYEFVVSIYLVGQVLLGFVTVGTLQLYLRSLRLAFSNLSGLIGSLLEIYESNYYVEDLVWLMNLQPAIEKHGEGQEIESIDGIEFRNVYFKYSEKKPFILRGIDFQIRSGEKIAIVGENGAGKSTLIKLIGRFYDPSKGAVLVSSQDLREINLKSWRKKIGILFQLFELYPFTVNESIGFGDISRLGDKKSIQLAAQKAGVHEFVESLPLKYENPLTVSFDKGVDPSIGQWQRFGIARMLFRKNAQLIILDEPTSNVDPEAEEKIFEELRKITKDKMLIFVTQRFSTVRIADRIFVVDKGKIIEQGTHKELMSLDGKYAKLFRLQAKAYLNN